MDEFYYEEITEASYSEMVNFAKWVSKYHAHYPNIIGGWAVWCHTKTLGSRDVDVVFPSRVSKYTGLNSFLKSNDYKLTGGPFEKRFIKELKTEKGTEEIIIDACSVEDLNRLKENTDIVVPWTWAVKYSGRFKLEPKVFINLPRPEVILIYKTKAVLDRTYDLKKVGMDEYLESKIWKDYHDIASILKKCKLDLEFIGKLLKEIDYKDHFEKALKLLIGREDIMEKYDVKDTVKEILKELKG